MPNFDKLLAWAIAGIPGLLLCAAFVFVPRRFLPLVWLATALLAAFATAIYFDGSPNDLFRINEAIGTLAYGEIVGATVLGLLGRALLEWFKRGRRSRG